jgi:hypothetical protein
MVLIGNYFFFYREMHLLDFANEFHIHTNSFNGRFKRCELFLQLFDFNPTDCCSNPKAKPGDKELTEGLTAIR